MKHQTIMITMLFLISSVLLGQINLDSGLVAYYPFNGNGNDESGNGNDGTINGPTLTADRFGNESNAYYFDGVDDFINTGYFPSSLTQITLSIWMKSDNATIHDGLIISNDDVTQLGIFLNNPASQVRFDGVTENGGAVSFATDANYIDGVWHHVIGTFDGSSLNLYIDGILKDSQVLSGTLIIGDEFKIGWHDCVGCTPARFWDGELDDIRIYSRAIAQEEIDSLYHEGGWTVSVDENFTSLPTEFKLNQNYPNPFNPVTTILYQLPKSEFVNLSIYNVAGQLVQTLVNVYKNAGYHSVIWNASSVGSGLYFYRIEAGEYIETKKCVILK